MRVFDTYLAVDWSARRSPAPVKPTANAVWVGENLLDDDLGITTSSEKYFRTRWECLEHLRTRLADHTSQGKRVFVGCDFAYGYPAGFVEACGLRGSGPPWRTVWDELGRRIEDPPSGASNHFQVAGELNDRCQGEKLGPFWGCPVGAQVPGLTATSPAVPLSIGPRHHSGALARNGASPARGAAHVAALRGWGCWRSDAGWHSRRRAPPRRSRARADEPRLAVRDGVWSGICIAENAVRPPRGNLAWCRQAPVRYFATHQGSGGRSGHGRMARRARLG